MSKLCVKAGGCEGSEESASETCCCEEGAISQSSDVPVYDKLYLCGYVKQIQAPGLIRNKSNTDHWFLYQPAFMASSA